MEMHLEEIYRIQKSRGGSNVLCNPGNTLFRVSSNLPCSVQTVGRGEILALVSLLRGIDYNAQAESVTDNCHLYNIYNHGVDGAISSANCGLYKHVFQLLDLEQVQLSIRWTASHLGLLENDAMPSDVSHFDVLANYQAYSHAGKAASTAQMLDDIALQHISRIDLALTIQRRLAVIPPNLPNWQANKGD